MARPLGSRFAALIRPGGGSERARLASAEAQLARGWSDRAFETVRTLAEQGHADAQFRLGRIFERAEGVVQNLGDAVYWYRKAAEQGHAAAQARLGLLYFVEPPPAAAVADAPDAGRGAGDDIAFGALAEGAFAHGVGIRQDLAEAARWNRLAAEAGDAEAQARLGHQLAAGAGVARDLQAAALAFRAAAKKKLPAGFAGVGVLLAGGYGGAPQYAKAAPWLERAAAAQNATAQFWLGLMYLRGEGVARSAGRAQDLLEAAADQGHLGAMYRLGLAHWAGDVLAADDSAAESWLRRAAVRGDNSAMRALAQLLLERPGTDGAESAEILRTAAEAGDRRSAALLAELYLRGRGVPIDAVQAGRWLEVAGDEARAEAYTLLASTYAGREADPADHATAARWLLEASARGHVAAMYTLGSMYRLGKGVKADRVQAARWYIAAAKGGSAQAAFHLGLLLAEPGSPIRNDAQAFAAFSFAAGRGHGRALCNRALMTILGRGTPRRSLAGLQMLERAAREGNVDAAETLVDLVQRQDPFLAHPNLQARSVALAVGLGSVAGAAVAVEMVCSGRAVPVSRELIAGVLGRGAQRGDSRALFALGLMAAEWPGGAADASVSRKFFSEAAERGHWRACWHLARMVADEAGGPEMRQRAERWTVKSAADGDAAAVRELLKRDEGRPQRRLSPEEGALLQRALP